MDKPNFVYVTYIKTSAEKLWRALTSSEFTTQYWFGTRWESDWKTGSACRAYDGDGKLTLTGEVLQSNPFTRLSYTFHNEKAGLAHEAASRVTYELAVEGDVVKLTVLHDGFEPGSAVFQAISQGWPKVLSGLKSLLETGAACTIPHTCSVEQK